MIEAVRFSKELLEQALTTGFHFKAGTIMSGITAGAELVEASFVPCLDGTGGAYVELQFEVDRPGVAIESVDIMVQEDTE